MSDNRLFTAIEPTTLSSGVSIGATSITPAFIRDREGNSLSTMSTYFGTKAYGVIAPNTSREEQFSFTGISGGVLTGVSHVSMVAPYTETSGLSEAHAAGETVIIQTNSPAFYNDFVNIQNDNTFVGIQTFTEGSMPRLTAQHSYVAGDEEYLATKRYVDGVALSGAPDASTTAKGVVEEATSAQVTAGTNAGETSARLFATPGTLAAQIQSNSWLYAVEDGSGADDTYTWTTTPTTSAYTAGSIRLVKFTVANTGACTGNENSIGAKTLKKYATGALADLETGDIVANMSGLIYYDGTYLVLLNPSATMPTTALLSEMATFFGATDITGAEAETLTSSASSNADTLHTHNGLVSSFMFETMLNTVATSFAELLSCGFSDASTDILTVGLGLGGGTDDANLVAIYMSNDIGASPYIFAKSGAINLGSSSNPGTDTHPLYIGTDSWLSDGSSSSILKNGTGVTISGTARYGVLGHNNTDSQLLVMYSTTKIAKFTGISGTTITNANDDVTLDTAVSQIGFVFDDTNNRYVCVDTTNNLLRKFDASGTTISTASYTVNDSLVRGVCLINDRYYLVTTFATLYSALNICSITVSLIPTTMTR